MCNIVSSSGCIGCFDSCFGCEVRNNYHFVSDCSGNHFDCGFGSRFVTGCFGNPYCCDCIGLVDLCKNCIDSSWNPVRRDTKSLWYLVVEVDTFVVGSPCFGSDFGNADGLLLDWR